MKRMPWSDAFVLDSSDHTVKLQDSVRIADATNAFATVINKAIDDDVFKKIHKQHSEPFPILGVRGDVQLERFAADLFGITARGAHLTVYTMDSGKMKIWVPRRNPEMFTYPNKLDTTVAGDVAAGETPMQNIVREAQEEASLSPDMLENVKSTGVLTYISYDTETPDGNEAAIVPDVIYVYDLEVDGSVVPVPEDGEVKEFYLMVVADVQDAMARGEFKTNSAVVMIDFLIRHGFITADNEKDFVEIVMRMHRRLPFPLTA